MGAAQVASKGLDTVSDAGTFAQENFNFERFRKLSYLQLERFEPAIQRCGRSISPFVTPVLSPFEPYVITMTSRVGVIFGAENLAENLRESSWFREIFGAQPKPPLAVKLVDANVESAKETKIRKPRLKANEPEPQLK